MEIRDSVKWFSQKMEETLQINDYKGGWESIHYNYLIGRLKLEIIELEQALIDSELSDRIVKECTDIANFAMMIADTSQRNSKVTGIEKTQGCPGEMNFIDGVAGKK